MQRNRDRPRPGHCCQWLEAEPAHNPDVDLRTASGTLPLRPLAVPVRVTGTNELAVSECHVVVVPVRVTGTTELAVSECHVVVVLYCSTTAGTTLAVTNTVTASASCH